MHFVNVNEEDMEELLLFVKYTWHVFQVVNSFFIENNIPFINVILCATDGAPVAVGRLHDFIAKCSACAAHCIHQHLLVQHLSE